MFLGCFLNRKRTLYTTLSWQIEKLKYCCSSCLATCSRKHKHKREYRESGTTVSTHFFQYFLFYKDVQTLKRATTPVARFGSVRFLYKEVPCIIHVHYLKETLIRYVLNLAILQTYSEICIQTLWKMLVFELRVVYFVWFSQSNNLKLDETDKL